MIGPTFHCPHHPHHHGVRRGAARDLRMRMGASARLLHPRVFTNLFTRTLLEEAGSHLKLQGGEWAIRWLEGPKPDRLETSARWLMRTRTNHGRSSTAREPSDGAGGELSGVCGREAISFWLFTHRPDIGQFGPRYYYWQVGKTGGNPPKKQIKHKLKSDTEGMGASIQEAVKIVKKKKTVRNDWQKFIKKVK